MLEEYAKALDRLEALQRFVETLPASKAIKSSLMSDLSHAKDSIELIANQRESELIRKLEAAQPRVKRTRLIARQNGAVG